MRNRSHIALDLDGPRSPRGGTREPTARLFGTQEAEGGRRHGRPPRAPAAGASTGPGLWPAGNVPIVDGVNDREGSPMPNSDAPAVALRLRQFNRFYTRHLGLLDAGLL